MLIHEGTLLNIQRVSSLLKQALLFSAGGDNHHRWQTRWCQQWLIPHSEPISPVLTSGRSPTWLRARLLGSLLLLELGHYAKHAAATVPLAVTQRVVLVHKHSQPIAFHLATQLSRYRSHATLNTYRTWCTEALSYSEYGGLAKFSVSHNVSAHVHL